ncbi:MAG: helix-turn-helix domain-containing protein [Bacteroidaceae bacterium]|nr:helix-turn-helix domain-containing protein [Bacteroidaceae bacterium]
MEQLKQLFCRYDMVCDNPQGNGVEISRMPAFFDTKPEVETSLSHVHPFYEIVWFQQGKGIHTVDFTEYPIEDNTVFFVAPGQVHTFDEHRDQQGMVMKICSHLLTKSAIGDSVLLKYNVFNTYDSVPYKRITDECAQTLLEISRQIEREASSTDSIGHQDYLQALVSMFIIQIERCQIEPNNKVFTPARTSHRIFLAFRQAIEANFREKHVVKEYADMLNVSTKSLTNYVTECTDYSPLEMINNRIIIEAKRLLRYSDMMIKEIAYYLGFNDPSYFVKFFRRLVKCSPAEYRSPE